MKILGLEIRKASKGEISMIPAWNSNGIPFLASTRKPMLLSTVYRCVDLITDSIGALPFKVYEIDKDGFKSEAKTHPAYNLLDLEPNENMTRFVFMKTLMTSVLLTGNGYAYIERDAKLNPIQLVFIPASACSIEWITDAEGIRRKRYRVTGFSGLVEPKDMIHVLNFSYDGIIGVSTLTHAAQTLGIATSSEAHAKGFFEGGGSATGVMKQLAGPSVTKEQKDEIYETWQNRLNPITGKPNGMVIVPGNFDYQPISVSPKDSQLLESRQFNVVDICRFFSVSPVKAFDLSKSSYSTVEATQLQYLTDTLLAVITKIELEFNRKIFLPSERNGFSAEFDTSAILRTDKAAQGEYNKNLFNIGALTPNEARRANNLPKIENGDKAFVQVNVQTLDNAMLPSKKKEAVKKI
jgi:phage portal protein, HK97 family